MPLALIHPAASKRLAATANIVAGMPFTQPTGDVIALDVNAADDKCFRLLTDVSVDYGDIRQWLRRGFRWNGADIPRLWQWLLGVDRHDPRCALASAFHDDECNRANATCGLRVIGDAIFISLLMPVRFNGVELDGVGYWRAVAMYVGVRCYSLWRWAKGLVCG